MKGINAKGISALLVWLAAAAVLCALATRAAVLALALPVALAYMAARFGLAGGVAGAAALGVAGIFDPEAAVAFALLSLPVAVAAAQVIRRRTRFRDSAVCISVAALAGVALTFGYIWLLEGMLPAQYLISRAEALLASLGDSAVNLLYQGARSMDIASGALTQQAALATPRAQAVASLLGLLREAFNLLLVPAALAYSLLSGLVCYLAPRRGAKTSGFPVRAVPAFADYELPRGFWAAFLVSYAAALAGDSLKLTASGLLQPTITVVYAVVFIVQALSFADFLYRERGLKAGLRAALHAAAVLLFGGLLMWLGIFENMIGFRRRSQEKGGEEF